MRSDKIRNEINFIDSCLGIRLQSRQLSFVKKFIIILGLEKKTEMHRKSPVNVNVLRFHLNQVNFSQGRSVSLVNGLNFLRNSKERSPKFTTKNRVAALCWEVSEYILRKAGFPN